ncbi:MAG: ATP-binding protein [bacterium]
MDRKLKEAGRVGGIIEAIMLYDMQRNQLHDFQTYLNLLPIGADLATIRIYDDQGYLRYAVNDSMVGQRVDHHREPACTVCHQGKGEAVKKRNLLLQPDGTHIFQADFPLKNSPGCHSCHSSDKLYLGNILTELTFTPVEQRLINRRSLMIYIGSFVMVTAILIIWTLIQYQVVKPIRDLVQVIEKSKQGELSNRLKPRRNDEVGFLVLSFNEMMDSLVELRDNLEDQVKTRTEELESSRIQLPLRENLAALGRLAAGVAHELGNPLTGISSIVQLVKKRKKDDAFVVEQLDLVQTEIQRLARLARQMVDLARPESDSQSIFDVNVSIQKAFQIARLDRKLKERVITLPPKDKFILVQANEDAIIQIVMNLLFNAADVTQDKGNISIDLQRTANDTVELRVVDDGSGIPDELQKKIFDPFFTAKQQGEGVGLGLSVSHSLARSFQGDLRLESSTPSGSIFLLQIPVAKE